jgi:acetaldehyde dehydrogenase / alcohol dehydrogenase
MGVEQNSRFFLIPPTYIHGFGASEKYLSKLDKKKLLLVTDVPAMERAGHSSRIITLLEKESRPTIETISIESEPSICLVEKFSVQTRDYKPDCIIAVGGGAVIDAAKALWRLTLDPGQPFHDFFNDGPRADYGSDIRCVLAAFPTTSGTGSEVTCAAVYIDEEKRLKNLLISPLLVPSAAIIDPEFALTMPAPIAAASGLDALVHAVESYICTIATPYSRACSAEAVRLIFRYLPESCADCTNRKAREAIHYAGSLAGLAISNSCTGIAHSLDQIGPIFGVPHGVVLAPLIVPVLRLARRTSDQTIAALAASSGIALDNGDYSGSFIQRIKDLISQIGLPVRYRDLGIDKKDYSASVAEIIPSAHQAFATRVFPGEVTPAQLLQILTDAY